MNDDQTINVSHFSAQEERKYQEDRFVVQYLKGFLDGSNILLGEMTKDMQSGSTLSIVIVPDNEQRAYAAVIGDSPVIILDANEGLNLSPDHNARSNTISTWESLWRVTDYKCLDR